MKTQHSFGQILQRLRHEQGLSLAGIAAKLDVTRQRMWHLEQQQAARSDMIQRIADALGVEPAVFFANGKKTRKTA